MRILVARQSYSSNDIYEPCGIYAGKAMLQVFYFCKFFGSELCGFARLKGSPERITGGQGEGGGLRDRCAAFGLNLSCTRSALSRHA
jgi:hypothetical protein